jgi:putative transposase
MLAGFIAKVKQGIRRVVQQTQKVIQDWLKPKASSLALGAATDMRRSKADLMLENALLRQQLIVVSRQVKRPQFTRCDRLLLVWLASRWQGWRPALLLIQPETLLRWHRELFRWIWARKSRHTGGKRPINADIVALIQEMANKNRLWGAERIRGELLKLGLRVSKSTIQKYLPKDRSPRPSQNWTTFLHHHADQIWACDFIHVTDLFFRSLFAFVIIELGSRRVVHVGVTAHPTDAWVAQQVREATPFSQGPRYLLRDNDRKYGQHVWAVTEEAGIEVLKTPIRAPRANAICERFVGSVRRECLDHRLIFNEVHLRPLLKDYTAYFNDERPHQGIGQHIPASLSAAALPSPGASVVAKPILGGLHHAYHWQAA